MSLGDANKIPRRIDMSRWYPAERAIHEAMREVEDLPPHPLLTQAVVLLGEAKERVADFVDLPKNLTPYGAALHILTRLVALADADDVPGRAEAFIAACDQAKALLAKSAE